MRRVMISTSAVLAALVVSVAGMSSSALAADEVDGSDIVGNWSYFSKVQKGVESKADDATNNQIQLVGVEFEEMNWKAKIGPKEAPIEITGTYAIDANQTPRVLDLRIAGGDGNATDIPAIYKVDKDTLSIRIREGGGQRPPDFDTPADDCLTVVFKRAEK